MLKEKSWLLKKKNESENNKLLKKQNKTLTQTESSKLFALVKIKTPFLLDFLIIKKYLLVFVPDPADFHRKLSLIPWVIKSSKLMMKLDN